jgi:hypothetical protein
VTLVFNASPLIVLAKAGLLDQLIPLADEVWIPEAVAREVSAVQSSRGMTAARVSVLSLRYRRFQHEDRRIHLLLLSFLSANRTEESPDFLAEKNERRQTKAFGLHDTVSIGIGIEKPLRAKESGAKE